MNLGFESEERRCPEGVPAWVMTFADLMSLLLAFFVLMFSFSEIDKHAYKQMAGSMKNAFGVQREINLKEAPRGTNIIAREFSPGRPTPTPEKVIRQMTTDNYHKFLVVPGAGQKGQKGHAYFPAPIPSQHGVLNNTISREDMARVKRIKHDSESIRKKLHKEIKKGLINLVVKNKKIILRIREKGSFPSGSDRIIKSFKVIADKVANVFANFNGVIIVSGHTDNIPIHTGRFHSNWELSAARAVSVIEELKKEPELRNKHYMVEAFADTRPLVSNLTRKGRAMNRRVEIKLSYEDLPVKSNVPEKIKPGLKSGVKKTLLDKSIDRSIEQSIEKPVEKIEHKKLLTTPVSMPASANDTSVQVVKKNPVTNKKIVTQ